MDVHEKLSDQNELCDICDAKLHRFMTTPILELPDGRHVRCCEKCADENFPGWEEEDEDD